jgi:hypothetical protein
MRVMTPLQQIQAMLPRLNAEDSRKLRLLLDSRFKEKAATNPTVGSQDDWLLPGIKAQLRKRGLNYGNISPERLAPNYTKDAVRICTQLRKQLRKESRFELKHVHLLVLGGIIAEALIEHLKQTRPNAPTGLKLLLTSVNEIPEAIERSFPGYLASGMVHMLLRGVV